MLARAGLAVAIATALMASTAMANSDEHLNCPSAAAAARTEALESQIDALSERLDALDAKLDQLVDMRREVLDRAKDRIETLVHDESLSQEQVDRQVARALAEAQSKGEETARAAKLLHQAMTDVRTRMDTLRQQMKSLAVHRMPHADDAG